MEYLPKDPAILVSSVNMLLRETHARQAMVADSSQLNL